MFRTETQTCWVHDVLSPQNNKTKEVVYDQLLTKGGWEGWPQLELAYGLSKYMRALAVAKAVGGDEFFYGLAREEDHPETDQRFGFYFYLSGSLTTASQIQHGKAFPNSCISDPRSRSEFYFVELKFQGGRESVDGFLYRADEDINKIRRCQSRKLQGRRGTHQAVWMIAITTSEKREDEDVKMHKLGNKQNLDWHVIPLTGLEFSKIWASCIKITGNTEDSLFAYPN